MKDIKAVKFRVKEVRYYDIEMSEYNGNYIPKSYKEVIELHNDIKNDPMSYVDETDRDNSTFDLSIDGEIEFVEVK